jgi:hypothetical protein
MQEAKIIRNSESGQASILLIVMLATFLLGSLAFSVDFGYLWFRRQAAQTAADAACQAGAMDMLYLARGETPPAMGFTPGTSGDCTSSSSSTICWYANRNGFNGAGYNATTAGSKVSWTFPTATSVPGVQAASVTNPFLKVTVQENIKTWFMALLGKDFQEVGASCTCGLIPGPANAPLIILNPTDSGTLTISGGTVIQISGGPTASIQINSTYGKNQSCSGSSCALAFNCSGSGKIDTSSAGPNGTGADVNLSGGPTAAPVCGSTSAWSGGTTGHWNAGVTAVADPYNAVPVPAKPLTMVPAASTPVPGYTPTIDPTYGNITGTWVATGVDSCPNTNPTQHYLTYSSTYGNVYGNCLEFNPGYYPNGIDTSSLAGYSSDVVIFQPGIYYLNGSLKVGSSTTIRNAWPATQPSTQGVVFYFLSGGPQFAGGSGATSSNITSVPSYYLNCSGTSTPSGMPSSLNGNVLVSQCSSGGTYVGSTSTDTYSASGIRGLLFFLDHSNVYNGTVVGAGASLAFSGAFYFHNTNFQDQVKWNGAGVSTTYAIGNIVVDKLNLSGSGTIKMGLNGSTAGGPPLVGLFQ